MARYEKGRKAETHARLVRLAAEKFRKCGVEGVSVVRLMADAGLTHGGFYAHFPSKDALIQEAVLAAFASVPGEQHAGDEAGTDIFDLALFIDRYLAKAHRDRPGKGCPLSALAPELSRLSPKTRSAFVGATEQLVARIAGALPREIGPAHRTTRAWMVYSQMIGALQLSRYLTDKAASDVVLESGRDAARRLAGLA